MKFSGDLSIDVSGVKPIIAVDLKGDLFDSNFLKYLYSFTEVRDNDSGQQVDLAAASKRKFEVFRFDKFIGYIQLNLQKLPITYLKQITLSFRHQLKTV